MTSPHAPHPDEQRIQSLFDSTASEPSGVQMTKLLARAREVPQGSRAAMSWFPVWVFGPTLVAAATIGVFAAWPNGTPGMEILDAREVAVSAPTVTNPQPAAPNNDDLVSDSGLSADDFSPAVATFSYDTDDFSYDDFDPLGGDLEEPSSDDELDAWLAATAEILDGG